MSAPQIPHDPATVDMSDYTGITYYDPFLYPTRTNKVTAKDLAQIQAAALIGYRYAQRASANVPGVQNGSLNGLPNIAAAALLYSYENLLINPFSVSQRTTPASAATIADGGFGPDRWKSYRENADIQYRRYRRGDSGADFTNTRALAYARFTKITNAGKAMILQQLESSASYGVIGQPIKKTIKLRANTSRTYRIMFIEWSGTEDTITGTISAWGAAGIDPTFTSASYVKAKATSVVVDTQFREFTLEYTPSTTVKNIAIAIVSDGQLATSDYLEMVEPLLWPSQSSKRIWTQRPLQQELALCQRYYEKSYAMETALGTATQANISALITGTNTAAGGYVLHVEPMKVTKRTASGTLTTWDAAGTSARITRYTADGTSTDNVTPTASLCNDRSVRVIHQATGFAGFMFHWAVDTEL